MNPSPHPAPVRDRTAEPIRAGRLLAAITASSLQKKTELVTALAISVLAVFLSFRFYTHAGPLWRDEVSTVHLAIQPRYTDVVTALHFDSAPVLFPTLVRLWSILGFAGDDVALRYLGFLIAMTMLAVVWIGAKALAIPIPLLTLALFGTHPGVLQAMGSLKPYGLGTIFALLAFAALWKLISAPSPGRMVGAAMAATLAVHTTYQNTVLVFAMCLAAITVKAVARDAKAAGLALVTGLIAAGSLLPYAEIVLQSQEWRPLNETVESLSHSGARAISIFSTHNSWLAMIWGLTGLTGLLAAVLMLARPLLRRQPWAANARLLYAAVTLTASVPLYLVFFRLVSRTVDPWHLVVLIGLVAFCVEILLTETPLLRWVRLGAAVVALILMFPVSLAWVGIRQTNIDLITTYLQSVARKGDLIVVNPWFVGITFNRYYGGDVEWMTMPPIEDLRIHRYDLVRQRMMMPDPLAPVRHAVRTALESGHRVWLVGGVDFSRDGEVPTPLPPAPGAASGWRDAPYYAAWSREMGYFIQTHASLWRPLFVPPGQPGWSVEFAPLLVAEGWRTP